MSHTLSFRKDAEVLGQIPWLLGLKAAKQNARSQFAFYQKQHGVTAIDVIDDHGEVLFTYPEQSNA